MLFDAFANKVWCVAFAPEVGVAMDDNDDDDDVWDTCSEDCWAFFVFVSSSSSSPALNTSKALIIYAILSFDYCCGAFASIIALSPLLNFLFFTLILLSRYRCVFSKCVVVFTLIPLLLLASSLATSSNDDEMCVVFDRGAICCSSVTASFVFVFVSRLWSALLVSLVDAILYVCYLSAWSVPWTRRDVAKIICCAVYTFTLLNSFSSLLLLSLLRLARCYTFYISWEYVLSGTIALAFFFFALSENGLVYYNR